MNRTPRGLSAKDYAEGKSQFEKQFPKPEESKACLDYSLVDEWKSNCEGWLEALKWVQSYDNMADMWADLCDEIEAIENANDSKRI